MTDQLNVEQIMQDIRAQILAQKAAEGSETAGRIRLSGRRLPADFFEQLYQLEMSHDQLRVRAHVQPSTLPLVGPLITRFKQELHRLVIYYINQLAEQQQQVNQQTLRALTLMAELIEANGEPPAA
ncbi:MAG: hypothetical protein KDE04_16840 [Anaerolineales bacterium]|nr:hypothetical protein [Anaerolineales bacterium]